MPNAWSLYLFPLAASVAFVIAGVTVFRRFLRGDTDSRGKQYGRHAGCLGILFAVVGSTLGLALLLTSPTPWKRQSLFNHVFHTPPDRIERFIIRAGIRALYHPLNYEDVVIEDRARIRQIAGLLSTAEEVSPNHPQTIWSATVEMDTTDGKYYFDVEANSSSDPNGTLVDGISLKPGDGGWNLGDFRVDGLEKILEAAVRKR